MGTPRYFIDKLSPELRVQIYGEVFGSNDYFKRTVADDPAADATPDGRLVLFKKPEVEPTLVPTAILVANRFIYGEAIEVLYKARKLRLTFTQIDKDTSRSAKYLAHVQHIQIIDCLNHHLFRSDTIIRSAIVKALRLPNIQSVTILSEYLAYNASYREKIGHDKYENSMTARDFAEATGLKGLVCIDVGRYAIRTGKFKGLRIENTKLLKLWPSVQATPEGFDAFQEMWECRQNFSMEGVTTNISAIASQTSFRTWVDLCEKALEQTSTRSTPLPPDVNVNFTHSGMYQDCFIRSNRAVPLRKPDGESTLLRKLGPSNDPTTLEWASELLAINIETFTYAMLDHDFDTDGLCDAVAYWTELEGGECFAERGLKLRNQAMENTFVPKPCQPGHSYHIVDISGMLCEMDISVGRMVDRVFGCNEVKDCRDQIALQKIFYLMIATGMLRVHPDEVMDEAEEWSAALLRKYFIAAGRSEQAIQTAKLEILRGVVSMAMIGTSYDERVLVDPIIEAPDQALDELHSGFVHWLGSEFRKHPVLDTIFDYISAGLSVEVADALQTTLSSM